MSATNVTSFRGGEGNERMHPRSPAQTGRHTHTQRHKSILVPAVTALSSSRSLHPLTLICSADTFRTRSTCANPQNHKIQWSSASVQQRRIWILLYLWLKGFMREGIPFLSAYLNSLQLLWLLLRHLKSDCMMQLVKWQGTKIGVPVKQAVHPGQKTKDCK